MPPVRLGLAALLALLPRPQAPPAMPVHESATVTIVVNGIAKASGSVQVALSNSGEDFRSSGAPWRFAVLRAEGERVTWVVPDVPYGEYAVRAYHDANGNGKLDTNMVGFPKEPYAFSNGARGRFGPPSWDDAKVRVGEPAPRIELTLK